MKVVLLAGGFGTRLSEYTNLIPKPMVTIGEKPILWHIMNHYSKFNHKDFIVALGYKAEVIKEYFINYHSLNSNLSVDLENGHMKIFETSNIDWRISLINTGIDSMTGERLRRLKNIIGNETFLLTYGDGLSNVDIGELVKFHRKHKKMVTVTAVRPNARFGELDIEGDTIKTFKEKPQTKDGWINGGFFVIEPEFFDYIDNNNSILEREPLEKVASLGELMAFKHNDFWQCMDTKRDRDYLQELWVSGAAPW